MADLRSLSLGDLLNVKAVSASRHEQRQIDSPRSMSVITAAEIKLRNYRTVPEALNEVVGVMVQETNYGGGSPIIRGMIGNRILILVDGIRLNNSIYRLGPNQYLNTIDLSQVERIEVIRGPGSVLYGSDAMGGLVNVITKPAAGTGTGSEFSSRISARYSSADAGLITRVEAGGSRGKVGVFGGISGKRFGNLRTGGGNGAVPHSGYEEVDGDLKVTYDASAEDHFTFAVQRVRQQGVERADLLASGSELHYEWSPQARSLGYLQYARRNLGRHFTNLQAGLIYHNQREILHRISDMRQTFEARNEDSVSSRGAMVQLGTPMGERHLLTYGTEIYRESIRSEGVESQRSTGQRFEVSGTYPDGSSGGSEAIFLQDEYQVSKRLAVNLGARFSEYHLKAPPAGDAASKIAVDTSIGKLTASAYASWELATGVYAVGGVAQGFRAPNLNDSALLGLREGRYEVGNPELKHEDSINYEAGLKVQRDRFSITGTYFVSDYTNLIDRAPSLFLGLTFRDVNGNGVKDRGEPNIFQRQNIGRALVQGMGSEIQVRLPSSWGIFGNVAWTRGEDLNAAMPLSRIPPIKGIAGVRWAPARNFLLEAYTFGTRAQRRLSPGDLRDARIQRGGTPGFTILNFRGSLEIPSIGMLSAGLENATNLAYRWHGSGIDAPGINVVVGLSRHIP